MKNNKTKEILENFRKNIKDTGSSAIQIALLTERIKKLQKHFNFHNKDNNSRRGLLKIVSKRRKVLDYLKNENFSEYETLIKRLYIRR